MSFRGQRNGLGGIVAIGKNDTVASSTNRLHIVHSSDSKVYFNITSGTTSYATYTLSDTNLHMYTMVFNGGAATNTGRLQ
jgi:hypothetical protein